MIVPIRRTSRRRSAQLTGLFALGCVATLVTATSAKGADANRDAAENPASGRLTEVLKQEALGKPADRVGTLAAYSSLLSDADRWQMGQVKIDNNWKYVDELSDDELNDKIVAYRTERGTNRLNAEQNRKIAIWCKNHQLPVQAKAHWHAVIDEIPNDAQARKELGHERVGEQWFSRDELDESAKKGRQRVQNAETWMPKLRSIALALQGGNAEKKSQALKTLREIDSPDAIFAIQAAAAQLDDDLAVPFVSAIARLHCRDACLALVNIALRDPTSETGRVAIEGLRKYNEHFYIPDLLSQLANPVEIRNQLSVAPNGELVMQRILFREFRNEKRVHSLSKTLRIQSQAEVVATGAPNAPAMAFIDNVLLSPTARTSFTRNADIDSATANDEVRRQNLAESKRQANAMYIIRQFAKKDLGDKATEYWNWWNEYNEQVPVGSKPIRASGEVRRSSYVTRNYVAASGTGATGSSIGASSGRMRECLVRGTLIQTANGPQPIESIRVGDMVVSQNVETGELALKPVLRTTVRPPSRTVLVTTESGDFQATGGHYFWVLGKGWIRARDLEKGMLIRDASGSTMVSIVEQVEEPAETFNLIVADFHTYLVGKTRMLSNDATELRPSLKVVPGLAEKAVVVAN